jgi:hypothetical protein
MAFTKMSAACEYAVSAVGKAGKQKGRFNPTGAHHPD